MEVKRKLNQNSIKPNIEERVKSLEEVVQKLADHFEKSNAQNITEHVKAASRITEEHDRLKVDLGRGVVEPDPVMTPEGYVKADEILAILPKQVPYTWGAEVNELVRKVRAKCLQPI